MRSVTKILLFVLWICSAAAAQELTLHKECEVGFRELIRMAQGGKLGADVDNANVSVDGQRVEVELVGRSLPRRFRLTPKQSAQTLSRYFDIVPEGGASSSDAERLGAALNAAFTADPYDILGFEGTPGDGPIPDVLTAWRYGGCYGVARVLERRMMVLAGLRYTVIVMMVLGLGLALTTVVLWTAVPVRDGQNLDGRAAAFGARRLRH